MKTKRALLVEPGRFEIIEDDIFPNDEDLLIDVSICGLCNWEINHFLGVVGKCPQFLGHEWAGIVVDKGKNVSGFSIGDKVTVMPTYVGFAQYAVVNYKNAFKLKDETNIKYALGEPLKCVITVLNATKFKSGDIGILLGCGPMGLWVTQILQGSPLAKLIAIDIDEKKLDLAHKYGATAVINPLTQDINKLVADLTEGKMADFVIEGTGKTDNLNLAIQLLKTTGRGRVVVMSSYKNACKELDFREAISRSAVIVAAHAKYSLNQYEDMRRGLYFLENGVIKMEEIITHEYRLDQIGEAFSDLISKPKGYIKGIVVP